MINQTRTALAISLALASLPATVFAEETTPDNEDQLVVTATGFAQERRDRLSCRGRWRLQGR